MKIIRKKGADKIVISHNKTLLYIIIFLIILLIILVFIIIKNNKKPDKEKIYECRVDSDCIKASCCHPENCVPKDKEPNCSGMFCTMICQGPLDCGAGHCGCVYNKCQVVRNLLK